MTKNQEEIRDRTPITKAEFRTIMREFVDSIGRKVDEQIRRSEIEWKRAMERKPTKEQREQARAWVEGKVREASARFRRENGIR